MSNQGLRQESVRALTGTTLSYEGDWHALFDASSIPAGPYNQRLLPWINQQLSTSYTELNGAMAAYAMANGVASWNELGLFAATVYDPDALAYLAAVEAADGMLLPMIWRQAVNTFVVGQKATPSGMPGVSNWNAIKQSNLLIGASTLAGALVPLKGVAVTNNNFVNNDYQRSSGLQGNASDKYIITNRNNNADPQNNKHIAVYRTVAEVYSGATQYLIASNNTGAGSSALAKTANDRYFRANYGTDFLIPDMTTVTGLWGVSRSASNMVTGRYAQTNTNSTTISTTPTNAIIQVFANGAGLSSVNARMSFYSIGEHVDLAALEAGVDALMAVAATL